MTYSSRNFLMSWGTGSEEDRAPPRASNLLSSAMMSLQTSTHSSQMKPVGPAISLRPSFWSLLQKEHRRTSVSPPFFTIWLLVSSARYVQSLCYTPAVAGLKTCAADGYLRPLPDDIINNTVFLTLVGGHDVVAFCVVLDTLDGLSSMVDQDLVDALPHSQDFT